MVVHVEPFVVQAYAEAISKTVNQTETSFNWVQSVRLGIHFVLSHNSDSGLHRNLPAIITMKLALSASLIATAAAFTPFGTKSVSLIESVGCAVLISLSDPKAKQRDLCFDAYVTFGRLVKS